MEPIDYTVAGLHFRFDLNGDGDVILITTPDITTPLGVINGSSVEQNPAATVAQAQATINFLLHTLGLL